ncbi:MAG: phosphotransferase family protein [Spirochaetes bacterium]|nr:MAG: phosphotransferase family protein [Spirochaetota bacterium]
MARIDEPTAAYTGEEFDIERVRGLLREAVPGLEEPMTVTRFASGYSNLTFLLKSGGREMVLRRPPRGKKPKSGHDMAREFRVLKVLKPHFRYCPEPVLFCDDLSVMDSPFYVMERIRGTILRRNLPEDLMLTPANARALSANLIKVLCELHALDYREIGFEDFGKPQGYVKRQVDGWCARYRDARTPDAPDFETVMRWLQEKMPPDSPRPSLIHNDYKFDNVVLDEHDPLNIIGVLDWEMATIGDPLMDLGNSLAYWVEPGDSEELQFARMMATNVEGMLSRREQAELYAGTMGVDAGNIDYYYCFGIFRLAVIAQQIYYRFYHGQSKDERFRMLIFSVKIGENTALRIIGESGL